ncbi:GGDEF domain-containing protein [Azospira restricta]|uniref:GGDEF domain-containing protein n=1 Tax=Azospira restricta TaxID=404405 RepID=A0A974Y3X3_9RHOO|nr:GGDEF domain-containing protein [Azospira restricta]QRJ64129.1 GGDEF domain-containing protein [Azospira restricta]
MSGRELFALSLARRLALAFALLALFAAGLTGYFAYRDGRAALIVTATEQLATATRVLGGRIAMTLDGVERDLQLLARHPDSSSALTGDEVGREHIGELFSALLASRPAYFQIRLIAAGNGIEVARVDRAASGPLRIAGDDLQEKGHQPYVFETLALPPGGVFASPATINRESGAHDAEGRPSAQLAMRVSDGERALGVVVINLDLNGLFHLLATDLPGGTTVYLTNGDGDFLIHPDPRKAFAFDRGQRARIQEVFPQTAALLAPGNAEVSFRTTPEHSADEHLASFVGVDALPSAWRGAGGERGVHFLLGLAQPLSGVLTESGELAANATRNVLLAGVLAALLAFVLARAVTASLRQIEQAMAHFGKPGALDLPTDRQDEIGALARRFAAMQQQIRAQLVTLEAQRQALDHEAQHDWLTGLANRRSLIGFLPQALARAARQGNGLSLFFIDLDGFKPINDTHGHSTGDRVLVDIAGRLAHGVRAGDFIARPGGDEFVVICEGLHTADEASRVADKLIQLIGTPIELADKGLWLQVGASIGIACYPGDGDDAETLTGAADRAMYAAKTAGRGIWCLAGTLDAEKPAAGDNPAARDAARQTTD